MELKDVKVTYTEEFIKEQLKNGICEFKYRKKDGSERSARGTRKSDVLKENGITPAPEDDWNILPHTRLEQTLNFAAKNISKKTIIDFFRGNNK